MKRPHIQFTVDEDFKQEAMEYAKAKGFETDSSLARIALYAYMRKNPLQSIRPAPKRVSAGGVAAEGDIQEDQG